MLLLCANAVFCGISSADNEPPEARGENDNEVYALYQSDRQHFFNEYERIKTNFSHHVFDTVYGDGDMWDVSLFERVYSFIDADAAYHEQLDGIIGQSTRIRDTLPDSENGSIIYNRRYQQNVVDIYSSLSEEVMLNDKMVTGWEEYFNCRTEIIFAFAAIILCSVIIAANDYRCGFFAVEKACVRGRRETAVAKFAAAAICAAAIAAAFMLSSLAASGD